MRLVPCLCLRPSKWSRHYTMHLTDATASNGFHQSHTFFRGCRPQLECYSEQRTCRLLTVYQQQAIRYVWWCQTRQWLVHHAMRFCSRLTARQEAIATGAAHMWCDHIVWHGWWAIQWHSAL